MYRTTTTVTRKRTPKSLMRRCDGIVIMGDWWVVCRGGVVFRSIGEAFLDVCGVSGAPQF